MVKRVLFGPLYSIYDTGIDELKIAIIAFQPQVTSTDHFQAAKMAADLESFFRSQHENEQRFLGNMASIIEKVRRK